MTTSAIELYGSPKREISVILPIVNEAKYLEEAVNAIFDQDFDGLIEIILAVGPSKDSTLEIANSIAHRESRVVVVENPSGRTAAGLNIAVDTSRYGVIVRVDGHTRVPSNYLSQVFEILSQTGAVNVGGIMAAEGRNLFESSVARAMRSPLGVGTARFHTGGGAGEVDTVYLGAFRKEALIAVGGYDEKFTRAQDWELNHRLRLAGGLIYFDPRLVVTYRPRPTFRALAKQYFEYGRWRRVVARRHRGTINFRYLVPPITVIAIAASLILGYLISPLLYLAAIVYASFIVVSSALIGKSIGEFLRLPFILLTMHMTWGIGFLTSPKSLVGDVT
jgi:glycosyltransferase involved in cell wall biosynthesis